MERTPSGAAPAAPASTDRSPTRPECSDGLSPLWLIGRRNSCSTGRAKPRSRAASGRSTPSPTTSCSCARTPPAADHQNPSRRSPRSMPSPSSCSTTGAGSSRRSSPPPSRCTRSDASSPRSSAPDSRNRSCCGRRSVRRTARGARRRVPSRRHRLRASAGDRHAAPARQERPADGQAAIAAAPAHDVATQGGRGGARAPPRKPRRALDGRCPRQRGTESPSKVRATTGRMCGCSSPRSDNGCRTCSPYTKPPASAPRPTSTT